MNGFERRKTRKAENICRAAEELFLRYGYPKTSMQEIAQKAGVAPATIFNYFGTKQGLFAEVLRRIMDRQLSEHRKTLTGDMPFHEKLKRIMLGETDIVQMLVRQVRDSAGHADITGFLDEYYRQHVEPFFLDLVEAGKKEGFIHRNYSNDTVVSYFSLFQKEWQNVLNTSGSTNPDKRIDDLINLFFYGLAGKRTR